MRIAAFAASGLAAALAAGAAYGVETTYDAVDLRLTGVVGVIEIETGDVDEISVFYEPGEGLAPAPQFEVRAGELQISQLVAGASRTIWGECRGSESEREIRFVDHPRRFWGRFGSRRSGDAGDLGIALNEFHAVEDYGRIVVRLPANARVTVEESGLTGRIGDVAALDLNQSHCGGLEVGDVAGDAHIAINGSGDISAGAIGGALVASVNGVGDIRTDAVGGDIDASINGSGDVEIASADGSGVHASINGVGDVAVLAGEIETLDVAINGVGDVRFDGVVDQVTSVVHGVGDVFVDEVRYGVNSHSTGAGRVYVERR